SPLITYAPGGDVQQWQHSQSLNNGLQEVLQVDVDSHGLVVVWHSVGHDGQGSLVGESWQAFGPVQVYAPDSISPSVLSMSKSLGNCSDASPLVSSALLNPLSSSAQAAWVLGVKQLTSAENALVPGVPSPTPSPQPFVDNGTPVQCHQNETLSVS